MLFSDITDKIHKDNSKVCISIAKSPGNFGSNFHNLSYKILNLNWIYIPMKVENATDLEIVINKIRELGIKGCSVSMPYKESVIPFIDDLDIFAKRIKAVNTIKQDKNGILKGYNTDFFGAKKVLGMSKIKERKIVIIGAGGVAKAIGFAVKELGGILNIANRSLNKAKALCNKLNATVIPWSKINNLSGYLLINCTSVGMKNPDEKIVDEKIIKNFDVVMDVVIYPAQTKLLKVAKGIGKKVIPGTLMCVYQAAEQFKIYTGFDAPKEIVDDTIKAFE